MSAPIEITLSPEPRAILARLQVVPRTVLTALQRELNLQNEQTIGYAQKNKLKGPRPEILGVRSNRLWESLRRNDATISGTQITGGIGSNVKYAAIHEYGFDGAEQVGAFTYTRRNRKGDIFQTVKGRRKLSAAGISVVSVRPFTRQMHMPARSFIRSSIEERRTVIQNSLSKAILAALEGAQ